MADPTVSANGSAKLSEQVVEVAQPIGPVPSVIRWNPTEELGRSGLVHYGGFVQDEFRPELQGQRGMRTFREMATNDAVIGALLFAVAYLIRQLNWNVEPPKGDDSPQAREVADFCGSCLQDLSLSWLDVVSDVFEMVTYGFSFQEIVFKIRRGENGSFLERSASTGESREVKSISRFDDGRVGWRKIVGRAQETAFQWQLDEFGGIQAMVQLPPPDYRQRVIPLDKALLFRTQTVRNSPEGKSLIRACWRAWTIGKRLEEIEAIGAQRDLVGVPVMTAPEGVDLWDPTIPGASAKRAAAEKIVRSMMVDEQMGVVKPFGWELELLASPGSKAFDLDKIIQRWDNRKAMTMLADFLLLGQAQGRGSYALSRDKTRLFSVALGALADVAADVVTRHGFPRLVALNGWPRALSPTLTHTDVEDEDLAGIAAYVRELSAAGAPMFPDDELENALRNKAKLPLKQGTQAQVEKRGVRFLTKPLVERRQKRALGAVEKAFLTLTDDPGLRKGFEVDRVAKSARSFGYRRPALRM